MKKLLFAIVLLFVGLNAVAQNDSIPLPTVQIAYINFDSLLLSHPQKKQIDRQIQEATAEYEKEYKRMQTEYNKKVKDYLKNNGNLLETIKLARQAEITEAEKRLAQYKKQYRTQLQHESDSLTTILTTELTTLVRQVAKEQNITVVLDTKNALYLAPMCIDLYPLVEQKLKK